MPVYNCKMCGMPLDILDGMRVCTCEHCGGSQTLPRIDNAERVAAINRANQLRRNGSFERAGQMFEELIAQKDPYALHDEEDADLIWSLVLCKYGIRYEEDPTARKYIPVCRRPQSKDITEDEDYQRALSNADFEQKIEILDETRGIWNMGETVSENLQEEKISEVQEILQEEEVSIPPRAETVVETPQIEEAAPQPKEALSQSARNALFLLEEADDEWNRLEYRHFDAGSRELRALAQKYERIAPDLPTEEPEEADRYKKNTLAQKCSDKAVYCRYLGAVSDLKGLEDPEVKEEAYHYLVSLGDYKDAYLIVDEYKYGLLPTAPAKKETKSKWLSPKDRKGVLVVVSVLVGFALIFGLCSAPQLVKSSEGEVGYFEAMLQLTLFMAFILNIPVILYLTGDRIAKWYKDMIEKYRGSGDDHGSEDKK